MSFTAGDGRSVSARAMSKVTQEWRCEPFCVQPHGAGAGLGGTGGDSGRWRWASLGQGSAGHGWWLVFEQETHTRSLAQFREPSLTAGWCGVESWGEVETEAGAPVSEPPRRPDVLRHEGRESRAGGCSGQEKQQAPAPGTTSTCVGAAVHPGVTSGPLSGWWCDSRVPVSQAKKPGRRALN